MKVEVGCRELRYRIRVRKENVIYVTVIDISTRKWVNKMISVAAISVYQLLRPLLNPWGLSTKAAEHRAEDSLTAR